MKLLVYEVLELVAKAKTKEEKIQILKANNTGALQDIIRGTFDPRIEWLLPTGSPPPYTPNLPQSIPSNLIKECTKLAYMVKGGKGPELLQLRRESMFIQLLESVHPEDAKLLIDMINRKPPKGLTAAVAKEAFPHLFA
jgi:hypothetical protein